MKTLFTFLFIFFSLSISAQPKYNVNLMDTLDQISRTRTPAKYFAKLYYRAIEITNAFADTIPDHAKQFVFGFESYFAPAFFRSYKNYIAQQPQEFSWQHYYADTALNELQYQFMGMNAHINGDMWAALKDKYPYDSLVKYQATLIRFQKVLNIYFDSIYAKSGKYKKIRRLHLYTLGMDKYIGRHLILHWRKRQDRLSILFYSNPIRCERRVKYIQNRMLHYNRFAKKWIQ
jgi:hypothetical protein